jgi:hypothetical protein
LHFRISVWIDTEAVRLDSRIFRGNDAVSPSLAGVARYGF